MLVERERIAIQVILLDNSSSDKTVQIVRKHFPEVELILPGKNLGFAAGVNEAARSAKGEFLLLLNPDTEILDHAIEVIVSFARTNPGCGLYGGRTFKSNGALEPSSCWGAPTFWSMLLFATGLSTLFSKNQWLDPESLGRWPRDTVREVGVITGCFLLVSAAAWSKLRGLNERYFMYGEDVDFALRARAAGYRPTICPDARLIHEVGKSSVTPIGKMLLLYRGKAELINSHWAGLSRRPALFFLAAGVGLRAALEGCRSLPLGRNSKHDRWQSLWERRREWIAGYSSPASLPGIKERQIEELCR